MAQKHAQEQHRLAIASLEKVHEDVAGGHIIGAVTPTRITVIASKDQATQAAPPTAHAQTDTTHTPHDTGDTSKVTDTGVSLESPAQQLAALEAAAGAAVDAERQARVELQQASQDAEDAKQATTRVQAQATAAMAQARTDFVAELSTQASKLHAETQAQLSLLQAKHADIVSKLERAQEESAVQTHQQQRQAAAETQRVRKQAEEDKRKSLAALRDRCVCVFVYVHARVCATLPI